VHRVERSVQRSRFVATAARAPDPETARAFAASIAAEMPDATHHCWAFVAGPPGSTARVGLSDAGEPHGTAGRPMLTALLHGGVGEIVVVCSRWFGGVKLGTGGLARAYADAVALVLETLPTVELVERVPLVVTVGYADEDALRRAAGEWGASLEGQEYGARVRYRLGVPAPEVEEFERALAELTQGRAVVDPGEAS
jgi:uncharacterized YigZ family protein